MKITVYDGANTIGGTKIHIEDGNNGIFLDFGMNFAKYSMYYEEFLRERTKRGIYDLWMLNLIPRLNIYRSDLIPNDLAQEVSRYPRIPVNAVLISHAHLDHVGNVALLDEKIPIVASPTTLVILKALRDTSRGNNLGMETPYYTPRKRTEGNPPLVEANTGKYYPTRDLILTDKFSEEVRRFMRWRAEVELANKNNIKRIKLGKVQNLEESYLGFEVRAYPVDHSIYGATAYIIEGDVSVAYTGDFRLHGKNGNLTRKFIKAAKNASILITEGTRVSRKNDDFNVSEKEVYENALRIVEEAKGLVIADFSLRNFERLESFKRIAEKTGRELVITTKEAYYLHALKTAGEADHLREVKIYEDSKTKPEKWEKWILSKYNELKVTPEEITREQENYILCFSFYDMPKLLDIMPSGGVYIYSSSEAFTEEQVFSFLRLWNWLQYFGFEVHGFKVDEHGRPIFEKGFHASGHISKDELVKVIEEVDPDYIVPVHTENPEWFREVWEDKAIILRNGDSWEI
ncbi:MBL fold metallo-hydrolase [Pyrococcus abyssi]|uniref:Metallo-beta-lactamase n=1 Tax=Pyrococcus abyssi (strain GE5 / Orsay) TaxID=272844 RepID=Q9UYE0_PYRAB|nr:ribonuclease J [Pyrococcus abyssi]CAB50472.1 Predicted hydrolase of the metallo-beta-lactamase superfamily [Pyrococcus abyssi GE5]CCE71023.1 TPA: Metallo-beta-lactamase [Pyrococcus abyssi GE5]